MAELRLFSDILPPGTEKFRHDAHRALNELTSAVDDLTITLRFDLRNFVDRTTWIFLDLPHHVPRLPQRAKARFSPPADTNVNVTAREFNRMFRLELFDFSNYYSVASRETN
jgi:hypothetical protein